MRVYVKAVFTGAENSTTFSLGYRPDTEYELIIEPLANQMIGVRQVTGELSGISYSSVVDLLKNFGSLRVQKIV